jgi:hypothetical protein
MPVFWDLVEQAWWSQVAPHARLAYCIAGGRSVTLTLTTLYGVKSLPAGPCPRGERIKPRVPRQTWSIVAFCVYGPGEGDDHGTR